MLNGRDNFLMENIFDILFSCFSFHLLPIGWYPHHLMGDTLHYFIQNQISGHILSPLTHPLSKYGLYIFLIDKTFFK